MRCSPDVLFGLRLTHDTTSSNFGCFCVFLNEMLLDKRLTAAPQLSWVGRTCFVVAPCFDGTLSPQDFVNQDVVTHFTKLSNLGQGPEA